RLWTRRVGAYGERRPSRLYDPLSGAHYRHGDDHADGSAGLLRLHTQGIHGSVQVLLSPERSRVVGYLWTSRCLQHGRELDFSDLHGAQPGADHGDGRESAIRIDLEAIHEQP